MCVHSLFIFSNVMISSIFWFQALELDPTNAGYKQNLELIEQKLSEKKGPSPGGPNPGTVQILLLA